jgi:Stage II sporulation protein E (SpoIIE)
VARQADCTLLGPNGPVTATLTASVLDDDARLLMVSVVPPGSGMPAGSEAPEEASAASIHSMAADGHDHAVTRLLLGVPISDGVTGYGVLTLARQAAEGRFTIADLALATELGVHLGVAIRVDRMFRHRSAVAEALQGSLLPARLPDVPGLELSAAYVPASEGLEVSGDFYDVFPVQGGWAIMVGDVCGKGLQAAAMTAAARHAIRAVAHWNPDPADELAGSAGRSAAETTRMVQALVTRFSQDDLRDDMTILAARVRAG